MNKAKNALTRKIGPLPAWVWLIGGGVLVWYYRNRLSGSASTLSTSSTLPTDAATPQPQTVLQPGESVYDPNTGGLITAPGGTTTTGSTGSPSTPGSTVTNYYVSEVAGKGKRKVKNKPKAGKSKNKPKKDGQHTRARSSAHTRKTGSRHKDTNPAARGRSRGGPNMATGKTGTRNRATGSTKQVTQQHQNSTHPARGTENAHNTPHTQHNDHKHPPRARRGRRR